MENVVVTVSGYHGSERFNLIKLISRAGASYVGAMSRSITHLVCWKFKGAKYDLAKKFNTIIVNHRWVEECVKQGKLVAETPYMFESGEDVGPLAIQVPLAAEETESAKIFDIYGDNDKENRNMGFSDLASWTDSSWLKEKHEDTKTHSLHLTRKRRNNVADDPHITSLGESSRKGRRLVKKNAHRRVVDLDADEGCYRGSRNMLSDRQNGNRALTASDGVRGVSTTELGDTSVPELYSNGGRTTGGLEDIEETESWNHSPAFKVLNSRDADSSHAAERTPQDCGPGAEKADSARQNSESNENTISLPQSSEVSCVICWTEFSSSRGILPCGHRFCYSCIQSWADHMVVQRKNSACPLCKASFMSITKVEDAGSSDQKIYSQTVPCPSSTKDIFILTDQGRPSFGAQSLPSVCSQCHSREPEDLLISCHICKFRCIHSYCLDPYLLPWTCIHCRDMQMFYHHAL